MIFICVIADKQKEFICIFNAVWFFVYWATYQRVYFSKARLKTNNNNWMIIIMSKFLLSEEYKERELRLFILQLYIYRAFQHLDNCSH